MNRKDRRASKSLTKQKEERLVEHIEHNTSHWGEIRRIKREYDELTDIQKEVRKPELAAQIDYHLAALKAA